MTRNREKNPLSQDATLAELPETVNHPILRSRLKPQKRQKSFNETTHYTLSKKTDPNDLFLILYLTMTTLLFKTSHPPRDT